MILLDKLRTIRTAQKNFKRNDTNHNSNTSATSLAHALHVAIRSSVMQGVAVLLPFLFAACSTSLPIAPSTQPSPPTSVASPPAALPEATVIPALEAVSWNAVPGWYEDDVSAAWPAFMASCKALQSKAPWTGLCALARTMNAPDRATVRRFFESNFVPHHLFARELNSNIGSTNAINDKGLITGYYEPLLRGSRVAKKPYLTPLYAAPDDLLTIELGELYPELKGQRVRGKLVEREVNGVRTKRVVPYASRAELMASDALRGKEIVWVDDVIEAFFLQVQGSGRVQLYADKEGKNRPGEMIRVAYADQNGHPYQSIGRYLVDRGELTLDQASMQGIRAWAQAHPERLNELLNANPSYVFFRETKILDASVGPDGSLGVPLTAGRSIAVDARVVPLGTPVFLATTLPRSEQALQRLVMAQDTGGAIVAQKGSVVRADYFWGFGAAAGEQAGRMKQQGQMWLLLPR